MTEYLDNCESACTAAAIHIAVMNYIPPEFDLNPDLDYMKYYVMDDGKELFQMIFAKDSIKTRMYGSPQELAENMKIYKNFPGSDRYFMSNWEPYFTTPIIYHSLKNEKFICKSDLFVVLQGMIVRHFPNFEKLILMYLVKLFLNSQESKIKHIEFIAFDEKQIDEIYKEIQNMNKEIDEISRGDRSFDRLIIDCRQPNNFLKLMKSYLPLQWDPLETERADLINACCIQNKASTPVARALVLTEIKIIVKRLQEVIKKRPEMFLPNSGKGPVTVRLFEDGNQNFVMTKELFDAMKKAYKQDECVIDTMKMEDVLRAYEAEIKNIEFIRYPIRRAKHRAVPVNGADQTEPFCTLAVDHFFEFLRVLIFEAKIFQRNYDPDISWTRKLFGRMETYFKHEIMNTYFIRDSALEDLRLQFTDLCERLTELPEKNVRNAKSDGFTVQNLKNELAHLGLSGAFPEIQDHAEVVYAHVDKVKKEKVLRTCDLYDAVEYCQLICFFERFPNYKKFLHNQKGCGRVPGLRCTLCAALGANQQESADPNGQEASTAAKDKVSEISKNIEKIDNLAGNLESTEIENTEKSKNPIPVAPKNAEIPTQVLDPKTQNVNSEAPPPSPAPPIPAPKESKNCQKCYRTCKMLNETKKELTRNEQKMKKLEKKLGEIKGENTKEIGKKDREMEEFNRKIQKSNQEKEELKGRIEGLEVEMQQLEEKLARQEQAAHESELKLTEQISLLEISLKNESEKSVQLQNEIQISRQNAQNSEVWALEKQQLEQQIGAQNQKIHEFYDSNIRLQAENEINSRMVQQLLDKLASYSNPTTTHSNPTGYSIPNGPSVSSGYSNPTTYSIPKCQICRLEMKPEDQRYCRLIKCQQCGLKLHTSCATNWISAHKTCPSCQGQFLKNSTN